MNLRTTIQVLSLSLLIACVAPVIVRNYSDAYSFSASQKQESAFENKVDTSNLSGIEYLIASIYNNNRLMYAIVVTGVMAILGTIMSYLTDLVLKALGLEVSRISHRE